MISARRSASAVGPAGDAGSKRAANKAVSRRLIDGVAGQRRLDVLLAEREADLAQVAGVGAQDLDLAGSEAGEQHQPIEAVDLDRSVELGDEAALHLILAQRGQLDAGWHRDTHVVQPHRGALEAEPERSLVERPQTELVEQRQHVGQRDGLTSPIDPEPPAAIDTLQQIGGDLARSVGQGVDVDEVERRDRRVVELVVAGGYRRLEAIDQSGPRREAGSNGVEPLIGDVDDGHVSPGNAGGSIPCQATLVGSV